MFATQNDLIVYPNPAKNKIYINFSKRKQDGMTYSVYDMTGKVVSQGRLLNNMLNVSNIKAGVYHLIIRESQKVFSKKIIVE